MDESKIRKAENLLIAIFVAVVMAFLLAGSEMMRDTVARALQANEFDQSFKAWGAVGVGIVLISFFSVLFWVPFDAMRKTILQLFLDFKTKRLDWWLESQGRKHVTAEILLLSALWILFVGLLVCLRYG